MYNAEIVSTETVRTIGAWTIDKIIEFPIDDYGRRVGKNRTWYDCIFDDTTIDCYRHLRDAIKYCQRRA